MPILCQDIVGLFQMVWRNVVSLKLEENVSADEILN